MNINVMREQVINERKKDEFNKFKKKVKDLLGNIESKRDELKGMEESLTTLIKEGEDKGYNLYADEDDDKPG